MNLSQLLPLIEARNAELAGRLRRLFLLLIAGYLLFVSLGNVLSASGLGHVNGMFAFLYLIVILTLPLNLTFWEALSVAGFAAGQPGGTPGFSIKEGIDKVWKWATVLADKGSLYLIFWGVVPFLFLYEVDTSGLIGKMFYLLPLIPPMVYFWVKWSPNTRTAFAIVGYAITAAFVINISMGIISTVQRATTDPVVLRMQEYQAERAQGTETKDVEMIDSLIKKVDKHGIDSLTVDQRQYWDRIADEAAQTDSLKKRAETFVIEAKPTDASWWRAHWHYALGAVAITIGLYWFFGRGARTAGTTPAGAHGSTGSTERAPNRLRGWIYLGIIAWVGYSVFTQTGWPGTWVAEGGYQKTKMVMIGSEAHGYRTIPQQLCGLMPDAELKFSSPKAQYDEGARRPLPYRTRATFYTREANGSVNPMSIANIMVNDTRMGEKIHTDKNGCVTVSVYGPVATMLGGPVWNGNGWTDRNSQSPPQSISVELRFYGWGVDDVNFSGY